MSETTIETVALDSLPLVTVKPEYRAECLPENLPNRMSDRQFYMRDLSSGVRGDVLLVLREDNDAEGFWVAESGLVTEARDLPPSARCWWVNRAYIEPVSDAKATEISQYAAEVEALRAELRLAQARHAEDIDRIGERLNDEATRRDWCGEYDAIVESLNTQLNLPLTERKREVEVLVSGYIRVPFSATVTVEVTGQHDGDDDYVRQLAIESMADASDLIRNGDVDNYSAEFTDEDEFDVEVA